MEQKENTFLSNKEENKEVSKGSTMKMGIVKILNDNPNIINKLTDTWAENRKLSKQIGLLKDNNKKQIHQITEKYQLCRDLLTSVFAERTLALKAHYNTLDKALASDDRELIIASLKGISTMISTNPLESFSIFSKTLDNHDEVLELDF